MRFINAFLAIFGIFIALASALPTGIITNHALGKRAQQHLFVIYYQPVSAGVARHWSLFLTPHATIDGAQGRFYQALHHSQKPGGLGADKSRTGAATAAGSYQGYLALGQVDETKFNNAWDEHAAGLLEDFAKHNAKPANALKQYNCQNFLECLVDFMAGDGIISGGEATVKKIKALPK